MTVHLNTASWFLRTSTEFGKRETRRKRSENGERERKCLKRICFSLKINVALNVCKNYRIHRAQFLADRTIGRAYGTVCHLSVVCL